MEREIEKEIKNNEYEYEDLLDLNNNNRIKTQNDIKESNFDDNYDLLGLNSQVSDKKAKSVIKESTQKQDQEDLLNINSPINEFDIVFGSKK